MNEKTSNSLKQLSLYCIFVLLSRWVIRNCQIMQSHGGLIVPNFRFVSGVDSIMLASVFTVCSISSVLTSCRVVKKLFKVVCLVNLIFFGANISNFARSNEVFQRMWDLKISALSSRAHVTCNGYIIRVITQSENRKLSKYSKCLSF